MLAQLNNKVLELEAILDEINERTKFLDCGHPIMMLENDDDIASFDVEGDGLGTDCWEGWGVCNGNTYTTSANKSLISPNMLDKFPVGAGETYSVGDTGGAAEVVLTLQQMPVHSHIVTDPGHSHDIQDPGHTHGASSASHTHTFTGDAHSHTTGSNGDHTHSKTFKVEVNANIDNTGGSSSYMVNDTGSADNTETMTIGDSASGAHTHTVSNTTATGAIGGTAATVTVTEAFIGIGETEVEETGITLGNSGEGEAHNNLPPYYAVLFVIKIG